MITKELAKLFCNYYMSFFVHGRHSAYLNVVTFTYSEV